jgi:hypothetical protein
MKQEPEHWTQWLARKSYKSAFKNHINHSSYSPLTNTVGLSDGSAEAQQILRNAQTAVFDQKPTVEGLMAMAILQNALDYVKGKNMCGVGSCSCRHTRLFFEQQQEEPTLENGGLGEGLVADESTPIA